MPIANAPIESQTIFCVAAFYPHGWERYGGVHCCETLEQAKEQKRKMMLHGCKEVHIWRNTRKLLET